MLNSGELMGYDVYIEWNSLVLKLSCKSVG